MNGAVLLFFSLVVFAISYIFYGKYLLKVFALDLSLTTPAHEQRDGIDYTPTKLPVLFGHHFASIAGAGPIVGPILAACFGWGPAMLWILFGCVFIGAVHDFSALLISVRNKGHSIGHIIEQYINYTGRQIFLFFCLTALLLVIAIFAILIAKTFVASASVASASLFFIFLAVIFGILIYRGILKLFSATIIFVPLMLFSIYFGTLFPCDLVAIFHITAKQAQSVWLLVLLAYISIASVVPVWILLQPRDYLNSFLLYGMVLLGISSIFFTAPDLNLPVFSGWAVEEPTGGVDQWNLFPLLFVTVACGACSGFHALVSSGTTSKQVDEKKHILPIGYGAMLLEGIVAVMALVSVAHMHPAEFSNSLSSRGAVNTFANTLASLSVHIGLPLKMGTTFISLTISAFMLTTLDTATRLTRFVVQELCLKKSGDVRPQWKVLKIVKNRFVATAVVVILSGYLALSGDAINIWPVFGASNQLLAALTLLIISIYLIKRKANYKIAFYPFVFMMVISGWALLELLFTNIMHQNWPLTFTTLFLIIMSLMLVWQGGQKIFQAKAGDL